MDDPDEVTDFACGAEWNSKGSDTQAQKIEPKLTSGIVTMPRWRLMLMVVSSACLSGIAVVLWNRHSLVRMRQAGQDIAGNENSKVPAEFI